MTSGERKLLLIFGIGCLLIIGTLLIGLWPYRELIGFLVVGLAVLAVLVTLALYVIRTLTDAIVKIHEQKLRQERLRPNDYGYYEIPLDGDQVLRFPPGNAQYQEKREPYPHGYTTTQSHSRRRD